LDIARGAGQIERDGNDFNEQEQQMAQDETSWLYVEEELEGGLREWTGK